MYTHAYVFETKQVYTACIASFFWPRHELSWPTSIKTFNQSMNFIYCICITNYLRICCTFQLIHISSSRESNSGQLMHWPLGHRVLTVELWPCTLATSLATRPPSAYGWTLAVHSGYLTHHSATECLRLNTGDALWLPHSELGHRVLTVELWPCTLATSLITRPPSAFGSIGTANARYSLAKQTCLPGLELRISILPD